MKLSCVISFFTEMKDLAYENGITQVRIRPTAVTNISMMKQVIHFVFQATS